MWCDVNSIEVGINVVIVIQMLCPMPESEDVEWVSNIMCAFQAWYKMLANQYFYALHYITSTKGTFDYHRVFFSRLCQLCEAVFDWNVPPFRLHQLSCRVF